VGRWCSQGAEGEVLFSVFFGKAHPPCREGVVDRILIEKGILKIDIDIIAAVEDFLNNIFSSSNSNHFITIIRRGLFF
jgi:hypothetical protein